MPERYRTIILLREWQGLSYREIAAETGLSEGAVEMLVFRARRSLAENLEHADAPRGRVLSLSSALGLLKSLLGGVGVKAVVAAVAVTAAAIAVSTAHEGHGKPAQPAPTMRPAVDPAGSSTALPRTPVKQGSAAATAGPQKGAPAHGSGTPAADPAPAGAATKPGGPQVPASPAGGGSPPPPSAPGVSAPDVSVPQISLPTPEVTVPSATVPPLSIPSVPLPETPLPSVSVPDLPVAPPDLNLP